MAQVFDPAIFDQAVFEAAAAQSWTEADLTVFHARFMEEVGNYSEWYEHNVAPRLTFTCSKGQLRSQITDLNALMPASRATLKAAMSYVPAAYQDILADHFLIENASGYCRNG